MCIGNNKVIINQIISSWHLRRLVRNRLQEESAMLPLKNKSNILELA